MNYKVTLASAGMLLGVLSTALGGWDELIIALLIFMGTDYVLGILTAIANKSLKTETGGLSSAVAFKGIAKKCCILLMVLIGHQVDLLIGINYIRDTICWTYILNELLSIIECAGILGVPMPKIVINAIDILKSKVDKEDKKDGPEA